MQVCRFSLRSPQLLEGASGALVILFAGPGEPKGSRRALQEAYAQAILELRDPQADRRLRDAQIRRGGAEAPQLDDSREDGDRVQIGGLHFPPLWTIIPYIDDCSRRPGRPT